MKYQVNDETIYRLRQQILDDIRECATQITNVDNGSCSLCAVTPYVAFETDNDIIGAKVTGLTFDEKSVTFNLEAISDSSEYRSDNGDNIYLEGLNEILDAVESLRANL